MNNERDKTAQAEFVDEIPSAPLRPKSELEQTPGAFAFAQAVRLTSRRLQAMGHPAPQKAIRYTVNPNLSFPPSDIEHLEFLEDETGPKAHLELNLMGLHGAGSPLPAYFTEYVAQHQDEQDSLRDFFSIFNHELIDILYEVWGKYRYYLQYESNATDVLSSRFFSFLGLRHQELREAKNLRWSRLLAYMGLIAFKGDAAGSLESILRHYFRHGDVHIIPCSRRRVAIPEDQQCSLGMGNSSLGSDCLLGAEVTDQIGKFRISITNLSWDKFNSFLPTEAIYTELQTLVRFVLRSRLLFDIELRLKPEEIPPLEVGEGTICRLGWSTWLGEDGDGIVGLEVDHQAL